jgi:hypothetical protein
MSDDMTYMHAVDMYYSGRNCCLQVSIYADHRSRQAITGAVAKQMYMMKSLVGPPA